MLDRTQRASRPQAPHPLPPERRAGVFLRLVADGSRSPWLLGAGLAATAAAGGAQLALTWLAKSWVEGPLLHASPAEVRRLVTAGAAGVALLVIALFASRALLAAADPRLLE